MFIWLIIYRFFGGHFKITARGFISSIPPNLKHEPLLLSSKIFSGLEMYLYECSLYNNISTLENVSSLHSKSDLLILMSHLVTFRFQLWTNQYAFVS